MLKQKNEQGYEEKKTNSKTWQREIATLLLCFLMFLAYEGKTEELEILVWPFTIFTMAAFGFKQPAVKDFLNSKQQTYISRVPEQYELPRKEDNL